MDLFAICLFLCIGGGVYGSPVADLEKLQSEKSSKFIVWFRNETTLLVIWTPPDPSVAYTRYKVSISPPDAEKPELYVEKDGDPPEPAQAQFKGLVSGREYNISLQSMLEDEVTSSTSALYRTVPIRPRNVTAPIEDLTETSFTVTWLPPSEDGEFDQYQVRLTDESGNQKPVLYSKSDTSATFEGLQPGKHYTVAVKTISGKVTSWPSTIDLTLKPLPVTDLTYRIDNKPNGDAIVMWKPSEDSKQDSYKVSWQEVDETGDDVSLALNTTDTSVQLHSLLPGRKYNVAVSAVSSNIASNASIVTLITRPLAPVIGAAMADQNSIKLRWRSNINSSQDSYELRYRRAKQDEAFQTLETTDMVAILKDLSPGTMYEIELVAVSHGTSSVGDKLMIDTPRVRQFTERNGDNRITLIEPDTHFYFNLGDYHDEDDEDSV